MKKEEKIVRDCLDEMYKASNPPITWKQIVEKYSDTGIQFCRLHKIKEEDYTRIKEKYKKKLSKGYHKSLEMELLNFAPTSED
jgi:transcription-repair coupling factor (superfamily II helicase)